MRELEGALLTASMDATELRKRGEGSKRVGREDDVARDVRQADPTGEVVVAVGERGAALRQARNAPL